jgi:plastocyanin
MVRLSFVLAALSACGTDAPASVVTVSCTGATPAATFTTTATSTAYSPASATVPVGAVVEFQMSPEHNVSSSTAGLAVDFGQTKCLQFKDAGTFDFKCSVHLFTGTITVQ